MTAFPMAPGQLNTGLPPMGQFPPVSLEQLVAALLNQGYGRNEAQVAPVVSIQPPQLPPPPSPEWRAGGETPLPPPPPQPPDPAMLMALQAAEQHRQMGTAPEQTLQPQIPAMVWGGNQAVRPPDMRMRQGPMIPQWIADKAVADQQRDAELAALNTTVIAAIEEAKRRKIEGGQGAFGYNPMLTAKSLMTEDDPGEYMAEQRRAMRDAEAGVPPRFGGAWYGPAVPRAGDDERYGVVFSDRGIPDVMPRPSFELTQQQKDAIKARKEKRATAQELISANKRMQSPSEFRVDKGGGSPVDVAIAGGAEAMLGHPDVMAQAAAERDAQRQMELIKGWQAAYVAGSQLPGATTQGLAPILERAMGANVGGQSAGQVGDQPANLQDVYSSAPSDEIRKLMETAVLDDKPKDFEDAMRAAGYSPEEQERAGIAVFGKEKWRYRDAWVTPSERWKLGLGYGQLPDPILEMVPGLGATPPPRTAPTAPK